MSAQPSQSRFSPTSDATTSPSWIIFSAKGVPLKVEIFTFPVLPAAVIPAAVYWVMPSTNGIT